MGEQRKIARKLGLLLVVFSLLPFPAEAAVQNDGASGADAGNTFATATRVSPRGAYTGKLDPAVGDRQDFFRFTLAAGASMSVLVTPNVATTEPITLLDPDGVPVDAGGLFGSLGATHSGVLTSEGTIVRLAVHRARIAGDYRLNLQAERLAGYTYSLCFMNCEGPKKAPIEMIFGGSLRTLNTRVLLIPPTHGDLGDPNGPTVVDYIDATLRGIHTWTRVMDRFATDYPQYAYLREINVSVEIFDGVDPVDPAGYDVVIGYVAAGPVFRGIAGNSVSLQSRFDSLSSHDLAHFSGRYIALSLFGSAPRAGQVAYDFPEINDLEAVTVHEFGHTFGLGHSMNWDAVLGPDLMNSPAPFVYGNGFAGGDGGERTSKECLSSLDLYGMAVLYRWIPTGPWQSSEGFKSLPTGIPYSLYC